MPGVPARAPILKVLILLTCYALEAARDCKLSNCETVQAIIGAFEQDDGHLLMDQRKRTMAFVVSNTRVPLGAVTTLRVVDGVMHWIASVVAWNEARITRNVLLSLSAEQLDDIGLTRAELI